MIGDFLKILKNWGIDKDTALEEIRSIRLLTYICFTCSFTAIFYSILFLFLGEYIPATLDFFLVILFLPSLILNKYKQYKVAKTLLVVNANIAVLCVIVVYGNLYRNELFYVISSMFGISVFKNKLNSILSLLTAILFYLVSKFYCYHYEPLYPTDESLTYPLSIIGLISICVIAYLLSFYIKNESNVYEKQINEFNTILESKKKYAIDSLKYAANIQKAIMGHKAKIVSNFKDGFILFKPKDIVSGDFYWFGEFKGSKIIAAADCTGHGVPAALMTIMGNNFLNQIVFNEGILEPNLILKALDEKILNQLKNEGDNNLNDGMDIAILSIPDNNNVIEFAGAMSAILKVSQSQIHTIGGTNLPIGSLQYGALKSYEKVEITHNSGDKFYLFSDGFQDQFGGPKGKKFMKKKMRELIFSNANLSMTSQKKELKSTLLNWQKDEEQTDDILIIGISV
jgi:serine phosphatase RsbU (regulator of sigma subunit)